MNHSPNQAPARPSEARQVAFLAYRQFNEPQLRRLARSSHRLDASGLSFFQGDTLPDRLARSLAEAGAIRLKELLESFEFFERTRRALRAPDLADLCCGHGLVGLLFAAFERGVERVHLVDKRRPKLYDPVYAAVARVAPWVQAKVVYHECKLRELNRILPAGTALAGVHACGIRTDYCIEAALALGGNLAVMPCCYTPKASSAPMALNQGLGLELATDVARTYRLEAAGYQTAWSAIPAEITPMNRIITATRRAPAAQPDAERQP